MFNFPKKCFKSAINWGFCWHGPHKCRKGQEVWQTTVQKQHQPLPGRGNAPRCPLMGQRMASIIFQHRKPGRDAGTVSATFQIWSVRNGEKLFSGQPPSKIKGQMSKNNWNLLCSRLPTSQFFWWISHLHFLIFLVFVCVLFIYYYLCFGLFKKKKWCLSIVTHCIKYDTNWNFYFEINIWIFFYNFLFE